MEAVKQLKICRLCATNGTNFRSIFNDQKEKNEIGEKISKCLPILISSDDELPGHICPMCLRSLNTSYKLLITVIETDGKLRHQLSQSRVPNQQDCDPTSHNSSHEVEKNEPGICGFCEISFVDAGAFDSHMETFHQSLWVCNLCQSSFETSAELLQHKHKMHYDNIDNSGEDYKDSAAVEIKEEGILVSQGPLAPTGMTRTERHFACDQCPRRFAKRRLLTDHQNTHSRKEPYACAICPRKFRTYSSHWLHLYDHKHKKGYTCDHCQREYKRKRYLARHMKDHLPPEDWKFECKMCKLRFKKWADLKQHMRLHSHKYPHRCDICGAAFSRAYGLAIHRKRHEVETDEKEQKESVGDDDHRINESRSDNSSGDIVKNDQVNGLCETSFNGESCQDSGTIRVKEERTSVSPDRPEPPASSEGLYSCETCHKKFSTCAARSGHQRIHKKKYQDYTCDYCQKRYALRGSLIKHILGHLSSSGAFECGICEIKFRGSSQLTNHMKIHSKTRSQACDICGAKYLRKYDMMRHRNCHGVSKIDEEKLQQLSQSHDDNEQNSSGGIEKNELMCGICEISFANASTFDSHMESLHQSKWDCNLCQNSFITSEELLQHKYKTHYDNIDEANKESESQQSDAEPPAAKEINPGRVLETSEENIEERRISIDCTICNLSIDEAFLSEHQKIHESFNVPCSSCENEFPTAYDFIKHNREVHHRFKNTDIRFFCRDCNRSLSTPEAFKEHQKWCESRQRCKICIKIFNSSKLLQLHVNKEHRERIVENEVIKLECPQCKEIFTDKKLFMNHTHEPSKESRLEPLNNQVQNRILAVNETAPQERLWKLRGRPLEDIARREKLYPCDICDRKFRTCAARSGHQRIHNLATYYPDHTCDYCKIKFRLKSSLQKHILCHMPPENWRFECNLCKRKFKRAYAMKKHRKLHSNSNAYDCDICGARYRRKYDMQKHRNSHGSGNDKKKQVSTSHASIPEVELTEPLCEINFVDTGAFESPVEVSDQLKWSCTVCPHSFATSEELLQHKQKAHFDNIEIKEEIISESQDSPVALPHPKMEYKNRRRLPNDNCIICHASVDEIFMPEHKKIHEPFEVYCHPCQSQFPTAYDLVRHQRAVHNMFNKQVVRFFCRDCNRSLTNSKALKAHPNFCKSRKKCNYCEKSFNWPELVQHLKEEHGDKMTEDEGVDKLHCPQCNKVFTDKNQFMNHSHDSSVTEKYQIIRNRKQAHSCASCDRKFNIKRNLLRHMSVHSPRENWEFGCELCKLKFKSRGHLKRHMEIHSRNHAHKCDICGAAYLREYNLLRHKLCHSAAETDKKERQESPLLDADDDQNSEIEKSEPVICGFCEITFSDVSAFDRHMETFHQSKWVCNLCQNSFATSEELLQHKHKTHYDNDDSEAIETKEEKIPVPKPSEAEPPPNKSGLRKSERKKGGIGLPQSEWICDQCQKSFTASDQLLQHIVEVHCSNIDNAGEECNDSKAIEIKEEIILVSEHSDTESLPISKETEEEIGGETVSLDCTICNVSVEEVFMPEHQKIHEPFELFCTKCHCKFPTAYDLINHKRETHNIFSRTVIRFYCRNCNRSMSDSETLKTHEKCVKAQHKCKYCNETFNWLQQLRLHLHQAHHDRMLKDKEVKIFECNRCSKVYTDRRRFRLHTSVHRARNKGRYRCKHCNVYYSKKMDLEDHRQTVHKNLS